MPTLTTRHRASAALSARLSTPAIALAVGFGLVAVTGGAAYAAQTRAATPQAMPLSTIVTDARAATADARDALNGAAAVSAEAAASDLDLGTMARTVDTAALGKDVAELATIDVMPLLLLPDVVSHAEAHIADVKAQTAALRTALDAAQAKREAEEAAAKAAAEEAARAAAQAAANTVDGAQATARQLAADRYGWGDGQFSCLQSLWNRESGWNYQAYNAGSGATGIPQSLPGSKMASAGADWQTNAATQIRWGLQYIAGSYGSPCAAWGHSQATGWY